MLLLSSFIALYLCGSDPLLGLSSPQIKSLFAFCMPWSSLTFLHFSASSVHVCVSVCLYCKFSQIKAALNTPLWDLIQRMSDTVSPYYLIWNTFLPMGGVYSHDIVMIEIVAIYFQFSLLIRKTQERRLKTLMNEASAQPQILWLWFWSISDWCFLYSGISGFSSN